MSTEYNSNDYALENEDDEHLTRVVIDTCARTYRLLSNEGDEKVIECDSVEEFMNVLELVRAVVNEFIIPHTVPNNPINGAVEPTVAKKVKPFSIFDICFSIADSRDALILSLMLVLDFFLSNPSIAS